MGDGALLRRTFARFDHSGRGVISATDLDMTIGDSFGGADVKNLICEVDRSGDGHIDYEEFCAYFHRTAVKVQENEPPSYAQKGKSTKEYMDIPVSEAFPTILCHQQNARIINPRN